MQRSLESRYKASFLGKLWPLLNQLSLVLIYTYVLAVVLRVRSGVSLGEGGEPLNFGLWLFAGLLPWTAFQSGVSLAASSVVRQPNLVKKIIFPLNLLPLVPIFTAFLESLVGMGLLVIFLICLRQPPSLALGLLPLVWVTQLCFAIGLGFILSSLTVFIQDIRQMIQVVLRLWFYLTPVIYPADLIPPPFRQLVLWLNPMAVIVQLYRDIMIFGEVQHWTAWAVASGISALLLLLGLWCYGKLKPLFADAI